MREGDQTFVFVRVSIKERSWLRSIKRAGSKRYTFPVKGLLLFQMVKLNVRLRFAFWFIRSTIAVLILNLIDCTPQIYLKEYFQNL